MKIRRARGSAGWHTVGWVLPLPIHAHITLPEARRAAATIGKSDIFTMQEVLDGGLWDDPLMDPET
jgi:hypothetical protein